MRLLTFYLLQFYMFFIVFIKINCKLYYQIIYESIELKISNIVRKKNVKFARYSLLVINKNGSDSRRRVFTGAILSNIMKPILSMSKISLEHTLLVLFIEFSSSSLGLISSKS